MQHCGQSGNSCAIAMEKLTYPAVVWFKPRRMKWVKLTLTVTSYVDLFTDLDSDPVNVNPNLDKP